MSVNVNTGNSMSQTASYIPATKVQRRPQIDVSRVMLSLALLLIAATFFLISPPPGETYPGAIPWSDFSILRRLTDLMSLYGFIGSVRGVEIKDFVFHLAAALGLLVLGVHTLRTSPSGSARRGPAAYAQILLSAWVLVSLASSLWSGDPAIARGQALLYALGLAWAVALAATLVRRDLPALLYGLTVIAAIGGGLCIWYYVERNPYHRPGFPLGNPTVLATAMLPGLLLAIGTIGGTLAGWIREGRWSGVAPAVGATIALVPMVGCLVLAQGRGALLALAGGLAAMGVFLVGRRLRWALALLCAIGLVVAGLWWFSASHLDVTMARGASVRLRFYAWRYAAELWQARPVTGYGAGSYPLLAGAHAVRDRALDPAAFMGEIVEHAHNEIFEILTEIGLVGGVTYVGGLVATVFAASALLRSRMPPRQRWLMLGLVGSVAALLADAMTGVALRLPGVPALFFTLLGTLWAASRIATEDSPDARRPHAANGSPIGHKARAALVLTGAACCCAAVGAGWLAVRNWDGVLYEQAAHVAYKRGADDWARGQTRTAAADFVLALNQIQAAEPRVLDPVRVLDGRQLALRCRLARGEAAFGALRSPTTTAPSADEWSHAVQWMERTYAEAVQLDRTAPALTETDTVAAKSAEFLAELCQTARPSATRDWSARAEQAWRRQRVCTPYDVETLLALTRYRASFEAQVGLLRDALRFGEAQGLWLAALARLDQIPGFEDVLARFAVAAGPMTPQTDLDSLIASMAPETERLLAAHSALHGDYAAAAERAKRAAAMYEPMRSRFPDLHSRALAEQAAYVLRADIDRAPQAVELLREAIAALPSIQAQKYEDMVRPYRQRLVMCLLAAGREAEARDMLRGAGDDDVQRAELVEAYTGLAASFIRLPAERRPAVRDWLTSALRLAPRNLTAWSWMAWLAAQAGDAAAARNVLSDAADAGVSADGIALIRRSLCQEFPALCTALEARP